MKNMNMRSERGVTGTDIAVSVVIIMLFTSLICFISYNVYQNMSNADRNSRATGYLVDILEKIQQLDYEDPLLNVGQQSTVTSDHQVLGISIPKAYTVTVNITKYNETAGNENKQDVIKIIKVSIQYISGKESQDIEISTLKTRDSQ